MDRESDNSGNENNKVVQARVIGVDKGTFRVKVKNQIYFAKITGRQMFNVSSDDDFPVVGDWVRLQPIGDDQAIIIGILPRKTILRRRAGDKTRRNLNDKTQIIAANIDVALIVMAPDRDFSMNRLERYLTMVKSAGIEPVIVISKTDLVDGATMKKIGDEMRERMPSVRIFLTTSRSADGFDELKNGLHSGLTYCLLGSSGVGKSTLINNLAGNDLVETGEISSYSGRGKHVTTRREMYFLAGDVTIIDNPGMREVGLVDTDDGLDEVFGDLGRLAEGCKYSDCTHTHEPGCRVQEAINKKEIDDEKYQNYIKLKKETDYFASGQRERKDKKKRLGKIIKQYKKQLRKFQ